MKILLATDGSEYSEGAAKFLGQLAFSSEDEIMVLHVISRVPFKDDVKSYHEKLKEIKMEIASKILDSTINNLSPVNVKISTALTDGYPDSAIIATATGSGADLIVMGSKGLKGIKSLLVGSVTKSVSINSPKPVFIIKSPQWNTAEAVKILYVTDGSKIAAATGSLLRLIPFPEGAEITILNVIPSAHMDIPERYWMEVDNKIKDEVAKIRETEFGVSDRIIEDAREILRSRFSNIRVSIKFGDPSVEIPLEAERLNTDIIAAGSSGMRGVKGMFGSVSRSILGQSKCSVLLGK